MNKLNDVPELLTGKQVATRLGISRQRVQQLTDRPDFPPPVGRAGQAVMFRAPDVDAYANGIRAFVAVNRVSIGTEKARELAARLEREAQGDPGSISAQVAHKLEELLETGGTITVSDDHALAVFGALDKWLGDTNVDVFGEQLMTLRYRLFGDLQDAGLIPRS
jgi:predicted DNA-binding transcriptional regulator AlpA